MPKIKNKISYELKMHCIREGSRFRNPTKIGSIHNEIKPLCIRLDFAIHQQSNCFFAETVPILMGILDF